MTKYEKNFGLNKPVFAAHATGKDVFVAPQVATAIAGLQKALTAEDAIVCVSGPVGSGKTTIAKRALEGIGDKRGIATIGRMQFGHDDVLELLLVGLGVRQLPKSTVLRFATFRRLLQQYSKQNARLFILVEDACRIGFDALSELEALTAADAGVSNGANLLLLGDDSIGELLRDPKMVRIKQRVRSRQVIAAQSASELIGYLKHSFRLAGGEFDRIFEEGSADVLHRLSDGLPRVVNNLVQAVMATAAEQGKDKISSQMIERVAGEEFGLTVQHRVADIEAAIEKADALETAATTDPEPPIVTIATPEPEPEPEVVEDEDDGIPELIQDTLPDLQILAPALAAGMFADPEPVAEFEPEPDPEPEPAPELEAIAEPSLDQTKTELPVLLAVSNIEQPAVEVPAEARHENGEVRSDIPDWERDPTLDELRPDLEALERAMAVARGKEPETSVEAEALRAAEPVAETKAETQVEAVAEPVEIISKMVPEIILDKQIQEKIEEATDALKQSQLVATAEHREDGDASNDDDSGTDTTDDEDLPVLSLPEPESMPAPSAPPPPPARPISDIDIPAKPPKDAKKADQELEKIASGLAKANTIDDVNGHLAETLFGEEFSMMAATVAANASVHVEAEVATGTPAGETMGFAALSLEGEQEIDPQPEPVDTSKSQRLRFLRELNQTAPPLGAPPSPDTMESIVLSGGGLDSAPTKDAISVDSIEDQITTSITPTLKAFSINPEPKSDRYDDDDDDDEDTKKSFFSRFLKK